MEKTKGTYEYLVHPLEPVWDEHSRILILGTFPSPKSREYGFYYGHPGNKFWVTLAKILNVPEPDSSKESKTDFLLSNKIAVWDVLHSCEIIGAADSSIRKPEANEFRDIINQSNIHTIFTTGRTATNLFNELASTQTGLQAQYLPSTSSANRSWMKLNSFEIWKTNITQALAK